MHDFPGSHALPVAPPPRLSHLWPYLAFPPAVVAGFALREWLTRRSRAHASGTPDPGSW